jgi:hypothetical protein
MVIRYRNTEVEHLIALSKPLDGEVHPDPLLHASFSSSLLSRRVTQDVGKSYR